MRVISEDLIVNIFIKMDDFYKITIPLIDKYYMGYNNYNDDKKKNIHI